MFHCSVFLFSEGVEKCIPWNQNLTQQIDLAFNIFFMVYFFIRVSCSYDELLLKQLAPQADNLLLKGPGFGKASGFKLSNGLDHRLGQFRLGQASQSNFHSANFCWAIFRIGPFSQHQKNLPEGQKSLAQNSETRSRSSR